MFFVTWTAIQLHPHRYVSMPSLWVETDEAGSDWWVKLIKHDSIFVLVPSKILKQNDGLFRYIPIAQIQKNYPDVALF